MKIIFKNLCYKISTNFLKKNSDNNFFIITLSYTLIKNYKNFKYQISLMILIVKVD